MLLCFQYAVSFFFLIPCWNGCCTIFLPYRMQRLLILCLPYWTGKHFTLCNFPFSDTTSGLKIIILHAVFPPFWFTECFYPFNRILGHSDMSVSICVCTLYSYFCLYYRENSYQIFDQHWLPELNIYILPRISYWKLNPMTDYIRAHALVGNWVMRWLGPAFSWMRWVFIYTRSKRVLSLSLPSEKAMR